MPTTDPRREAPERAGGALLTCSREPHRSRGRGTDGLWRGGERAVIARLLEGDPLGLRPRIAARIRARSLLLDAERVLLEALATCAREGPLRRGRPGFERWLDGVAERAIDELLARPIEAGEAWSDLSRPLGFDPVRLARASTRFNALDEDARLAFFQLVLAGRSLEECAASRGRPAATLARDARRALQLFLEQDESLPTPSPGGPHES